MGIIEQMINEATAKIGVKDWGRKIVVSNITEQALKQNEEITLQYNEESGHFSTRIIGSVFFTAHAAGRLIGHFCQIQRAHGAWDDKTRRNLLYLLAGGIIYDLLDEIDEEKKDFETLDRVYGEGLAALDEIIGKPTEDTEELKKENEILKKQVESLQYALGKTMESAIAGVEIQPAKMFMGIPIEEAIEVLRKHAEEKK